MVPGSNDVGIVYTQYGLLYRISISGAFAPEPFGDISGIMTSQVKGDEGLMSVAFEPGYPGYVYLNYTAGAPDAYYRPAETPAPTIPADPKRNVISRFAIVNDVLHLDSEEPIIEVLEPHQWHNVNEIVFHDGLMYVGAGDGGGGDAEHDPDHGQGATNLLATIFRIDPNPPGATGYTVPDGNPFDDGAGPNADEIWAIGLRNPWRMSFEGDTLWAGDVGEFAWEEIDEILPGMNYGWDIVEGPYGDPLGHFCQGAHAPDCTPPPSYKQPRTAYCHTFVFGCEYTGDEQDTAVIGGYVYHGASLPELEGWYVYGDLYSARLRAFDTTSNDPPILLAGIEKQPCSTCLRSFTRLPNGEILAVATPYGEDGAIYRLTRATATATPTAKPSVTPAASVTPTTTPTPTPTPAATP